jgi:hypothetical protein
VAVSVVYFVITWSRIMLLFGVVQHATLEREAGRITVQAEVTWMGGSLMVGISAFQISLRRSIHVLQRCKFSS